MPNVDVIEFRTAGRDDADEAMPTNHFRTPRYLRKDGGMFLFSTRPKAGVKAVMFFETSEEGESRRWYYVEGPGGGDPMVLLHHMEQEDVCEFVEYHAYETEIPATVFRALAACKEIGHGR